MIYLLAFALSLAASLTLTPVVRRLAIKYQLVDNPVEADRKQHKSIMPRAGGVAIWLTFFVVSCLFLPELPRPFWGLMASCSIVFCLGLWDDFRRLPPWFKLIIQMIAAGIAITVFGLGIDVLTNPFGNQLVISGPMLHFIGGTVSLGSFALTMIWLVGMTNTVNFLDGLDGLAGGVSAIAAFILFLVSILPRINQPATALLAIILCGACLGFLRYNFHPARIFLGDGGAYFLGMLLGSLAIISGAKLATALLVLGVPVIDAVWAVVRRLLAHRSPFSADRGHVHYLLLDLGLSQRQVALVIYSFALAFGLVSIIAGSVEKLIALAILTAGVAGGILYLTLGQAKRSLALKSSIITKKPR